MSNPSKPFYPNFNPILPYSELFFNNSEAFPLLILCEQFKAFLFRHRHILRLSLIHMKQENLDDGKRGFFMNPRKQASPTRSRKRRPNRTSTDKGGSDFNAIVKNALVGATIALSGALLLLLLAAKLCLQAENPLSLARPIGLTLLYLCDTTAGLLTAKRQKKQYLLCGLTAGILVTVFFWMLTLLFRKEGDAAFSLSLSLLLRGLILPVSCIGAFLGAPKKSPRRHHR